MANSLIYGELGKSGICDLVETELVFFWDKLANGKYRYFINTDIKSTQISYQFLCEQ